MTMRARFLIWFTNAGADRARNTVTPKPVPQIATDEQTGKPYELVPETPSATRWARTSATYSILALAFLLWLLFDTWSGRNVILVSLGYNPANFVSNSFRLWAFVAIGGAMGGAVDGIRSIIVWHSERGAYGARFICKDIALPLIGAAVALFAYVTVRCGVGVFSGNFSLDQNGQSPTVAAFAVASLAGFNAVQVFRWLDAQANKLFSVTDVSQTIVPDLTGMTTIDAAAALKGRKLVPGHTSGDATAKVISQSPASGSTVPEQAAVDMTFGPDTGA